MPDSLDRSIHGKEDKFGGDGNKRLGLGRVGVQASIPNIYIYLTAPLGEAATFLRLLIAAIRKTDTTSLSGSRRYPISMQVEVMG